MIVAADGSGHFTSIQEAVDHIPDDGSGDAVIFIKNGVYKEKLHVEKRSLRLVGECSEHTIITCDDYARKKFPDGSEYETFNSYSVFIGADDITVENITMENSAGRGEAVGQAVAAYVDGDRVHFRNCRFLGHQDTLFTGPLPEKPLKRDSFGGPRDGAPRRHGRQFYENCFIQGDVDFIFGSATAVFQHCEIFTKNRLKDGGCTGINGWITAASTPENVRFGYVFIDCKLTSDAPPQSVYLGRPWRNHAKTAFIGCWMDGHIQPEGWDNWSKPESERTVNYCEFNSRGPGAVTDQRVKWAKTLTMEEAEAFTLNNILSGSDGWNPADRAERTID
ncbi:pectinesterase family protein [Paenibacillus alkalitolerans]|uniref:pectinesterase family protein n=1 Tax=Paenibacillus alkalitolerans TaxID=2799335 RepID=UPI0018F70179|nr:pectinesterase family protein [Paenibacillus alkalitolerans]